MLLHVFAGIGVLLLSLLMLLVVFVVADWLDKLGTWLNNKFIDWYMRYYALDRSGDSEPDGPELGVPEGETTESEPGGQQPQ